MRLDLALVATTLLSTATAGVIEPKYMPRMEVAPQDENDLFKRKGGGGGGGRGGGGGGSRGGSSSSGSSSGSSGSSSGSSGSSSGSSGSSGSSSGSRGGSSSSGSSSSNRGSGSAVGGSSPGGSGPPRRYGGGGYYGGGAAVPFAAGAAAGALTAYVLTSSALAFWPGHWYNRAYLYDYTDKVTFHNATTNKDETLPVTCGCSEGAECSCGDNVETAKELIGNGTYAALNKSIIDVGEYKNRKTILINGTLPNGTTSPGGSDSSSGSDQSSSAGSLASVAGVWPVVACVLATVFLA